MKAIRILLLGLIMTLPFANHAFANTEANFQEKEIDGQMIRLAFAEEAVQPGHNQISVHIKDTQGNPVANAKVAVVAKLYKETSSGSGGGHSMDMGGGKATTEQTLAQTVKTDLTATPEVGEYEGELKLDESGHWMITVNSTVNGQVRSVEFTQEVAKSGPNITVLTLFFGAIAAIIGVAAITRKKRAKAVAAEVS